MKYLFVGGCKDGERMSTAGQPYYDVLIDSEEIICVPNESAIGRHGPKTQRYRRVYLGGACVYLIEKNTIMSLFNKLIAGYKKDESG